MFAQKPVNKDSLLINWQKNLYEHHKQDSLYNVKLQNQIKYQDSLLITLQKRNKRIILD